MVANPIDWRDFKTLSWDENTEGFTFMMIFRISSALPAKEIREMLADEEALIIRKDFVQSEEELMLAFHLAKKTLEKKRNIAKKLKYEFLLWLSGRTDIKSAIRSTDAKDSKDILLIVLSGKKNILEKLQAKEKPLKLKKRAEPLALERISLGRIK